MPDRCPLCRLGTYILLLTVRIRHHARIIQNVRICSNCCAYHPDDRLSLLKAVTEACR